MQATHSQERLQRWLAWLSAALLALSFLFSTLIQMSPVQAAELTSRSITMGSTRENAETSYTFTFTVPGDGVQQYSAFRVEFCDNSPLPNTQCDYNAVGDDIPQVDANAGSAAALNGTPSFNSQNISLTAPGVGDQFLTFTLAAATTPAGNTVFAVTVDNIDNPDNSTDSPTNPNNSFYARLYAYDENGAPAVTTGSGNTFPTTNQVDTGGIALSTAEQLTVLARVQETLNFCVGTTDAASNNDCTDISGNTVDLGVVDSGGVSVSPVAATSGGNNVNGLAMVRTNAANGLVIDYFAQQASTGTNHLGALRVNGAVCNVGAVETDQCFLSAGTTQNAIVAGTEEFGMTISSVDVTNGSTANITRDGEYDGDGTAGGGWAWDESGSPDRIASSGTVVDDEMLILRFAATSAITTPTGAYSVVSTYIATPTF